MTRAHAARNMQNSTSGTLAGAETTMWRAGLEHSWVLRAAQKMQSDGWRRLTRPQ